MLPGIPMMCVCGRESRTLRLDMFDGSFVSVSLSLFSLSRALSLNGQHQTQPSLRHIYTYIYSYVCR